MIQKGMGAVAEGHPVDVVRASFPRLTDSEKMAAEYLLHHYPEVPEMSIRDLSQSAKVSEATIVRLSKKLGYSGFPHMKLSFAKTAGVHRQVYETIGRDDDATQLIDKTVHLFSESLRQSSQTLDPSMLERAVQALVDSRRIVFAGIGGSGAVAEVARQRLLELGLFAVVCVDPPTMPRLARTAGPSDVYLGVSHLGETQEVADFLRLANRSGAGTIGITSIADSTVGQQCSILLQNFSYPMWLGPEAGISRASQILVLDILCMALAFRMSHEKP